MTKKERRKQDKINRRRRLHRMQGGLCFYCGDLMVLYDELPQPVPSDACTHDHLWPKNAGGKDDNNLVAACEFCNTAKGDFLPSLPLISKYREVYGETAAAVQLRALLSLTLVNKYRKVYG